MQKHPFTEWDLVHETQKHPFADLVHETQSANRLFPQDFNLIDLEIYNLFLCILFLEDLIIIFFVKYIV